MKSIVLLVLCAVLLSACSPAATLSPTATAAPSETPTPVPTVPSEIFAKIEGHVQSACIYINPTICKDAEVIVFNTIQPNTAEKANGITEILCIATNSIYANKDSAGNPTGQWHNSPKTYAYAKTNGEWREYGGRFLESVMDDYKLEKADTEAKCDWMVRN